MQELALPLVQTNILNRNVKRISHTNPFISNQTKKDLIDFYKVPEEKITVCYQSCNPVFSHTLPEEAIQRVKIKYGLPEKFLLSVGSIIERKNLMNVCKALLLLRNECPLPLVIIGEGNCYKQKVEKFIQKINWKAVLFFFRSVLRPKVKILNHPKIFRLYTKLQLPWYMHPILKALAYPFWKLCGAGCL